MSGTIGAWNGPVATTTASARIRVPFASTTKPSASLLSERTGVESSTGSPKRSTYRAR